LPYGHKVMAMSKKKDIKGSLRASILNHSAKELNVYEIPYYALQPLKFNKQFMWLWYILGIGYGSVIIAFSMLNSPDLQSPNIVKLCTFWLLIDFGLVVLLTVYYFMQYYAFKDKDQALTPEQIEKKFYMLLDTTATKAEGIDQPKPTM
jgi:hypothetical protein